jgi:hypothetical protein
MVMKNLHYFHLVVYHDWWDLAVNTTIKNKNKPIELLTLVLFGSCYMFRSTFGTIFRQSQIRFLLLNCPNMVP